MSVERTYYCDGPECNCHVRTVTPPPYLPSSFIEVRSDREGVHPTEGTAYFCSWDCLMKFAAARPEDEVIPWSDVPPPEGESNG